MQFLGEELRVAHAVDGEVGLLQGDRVDVQVEDGVAMLGPAGDIDGEKFEERCVAIHDVHEFI